MLSTLNFQNFELENNLLQTDKKSGEEKNMSRCALPPEDKGQNLHSF